MSTTVLPATIAVTDLPLGTTVDTTNIIMAVQTVGGVQQSVQLTIGQMLGTSVGALPPAGSASQILAKNSGSDYDTSWVNLSTLVSASTGLFVTGTATIAIGVATGGVGTRQLATNSVVATSIATGAVYGTAIATNAAILLSQLGSIAPGTVVGNPATATSTVVATTNIALGTAGFTGVVRLIGFASGQITLQPGTTSPDTYNFNLPGTAGTAGQALITQGGATNAITYTSFVQNVGWGLTGANATSFTASMATVTPARGFEAPVNCAMTASILTSVLTISLVANTGTAASATTPMLIPFRSATSTTGLLNWAAITGTANLTTIIGASFGVSTSVPFRLWVGAFYSNATTIIPALMNCSNSVTIFPLSQNGSASSIGITATASSPGVFYSNATATNAAFTIIGYIEYASGISVPGTYSSLPTSIQLLGPGIKKPGEIVQVVAPNLSTVAPTTLTTGLTSSVISASITPTSAVNLVQFSAAHSVLTSTGTSIVTTQMYRGASTTFSGQSKYVGTTGMMFVMGMDKPNAASATTYLIKGAVAAGTASIPAVGADGASLILTELVG